LLHCTCVWGGCLNWR